VGRRWHAITRRRRRVLAWGVLLLHSTHLRAHVRGRRVERRRRRCMMNRFSVGFFFLAL